MTELTGRTVAITGASRGLGYALAIAFARAGASVSLCARSASGLEPLVQELETLGARFTADAVDVADDEEVRWWAEHTAGALGPPAALINNASILGPREPLLAISPSEWRDVLNANLTGAFTVIRAFAPLMIRAGGGAIINVSSGASLPPRVNWGAYAVSKSGLDALSQNLAAELKESRVRVNIVDPGALRTDMRAEAYPGEDPATLKEPESIVPLFVWLAGDGAAEVTGQRFQADEWLRQRPTAASPGRA